MILKLAINGQDVEVDLNDLLKISSSLEIERQQTAAHLGYFGELWASAQRMCDEADLAYRHWRATSRAAHHGAADAKGKPLADAKLTDLIEATPEFRMLKSKIIDAQYQANAARVVYEALAHKARLLTFLSSRDWVDTKAAGDWSSVRDDAETDRENVKRAVAAVFMKGDEE